MKITLTGAGKKFYSEWIFRNANLSFETGGKTVILGPNGSGKSTLLQVIAGAIIPNEGKLAYQNHDTLIDPDEVYSFVSFASPYLELIEEFTLREIVRFHFRFKNPHGNIGEDDIIRLTGLNDSSEKTFRHFSSGMKQRVKLTLAMISDCPVLILDEPCSNLDAAGVQWYTGMVDKYSPGRIVIVASNQHKEEYSFCDKQISMSELK